MIIATAGHVDHGKTTLLRALTGASGDRLPEEKRRGMTIDLGYAFLTLTDGRVLGFIDVPGHEKFLTNMLAGVGGIQHALLVVACDDGIMPQTREHLTILRLLGTPALTVALTKADRVTAERVTEVCQQIEHELTNQNWQQVRLFITSAANGTGIDELREHLIKFQQQKEDHRQRFRLAIDRAFTIKGSGLVVTGTAFSGQVNVGDTLWLTGSNQPVRVKSLRGQNTPAETASSGERIALNIAGNVSKEQINRGDWLLTQEPLAAVGRVLAILSSNQPIHHWQSVHLHHAASHITGRISQLQEDPIVAGENSLVELVLNEPLFLAENDRIIIRDIGANVTLAGARVLCLRAPRRGKRQPAYLAKLVELASAVPCHRGDEQILKLRLTEGSLSLAEFAWARQLSERGLQALLQDFDGIVAGGIAVEQRAARHYQQKLLATLAHYHEQHDDQLGVGRARLKRMALPGESATLVFNLIDQLLAAEKLHNTRGWLHLPGHGLDFTPQEQLIWQKIADKFANDPLWVRDLVSFAEVEEGAVRGVLRKSAQLGFITAIVKDRYYTTVRIRQFADLIRARHLSYGSTNAADFRDQLDIGRKLAVQILEFFDRSGFTRRKGNDHLLRDSALFTD